MSRRIPICPMPPDFPALVRAVFVDPVYPPVEVTLEGRCVSARPFNRSLSLYQPAPVPVFTLAALPEDPLAHAALLASLYPGVYRIGRCKGPDGQPGAALLMKTRYLLRSCAPAAELSSDERLLSLSVPRPRGTIFPVKPKTR